MTNNSEYKDIYEVKSIQDLLTVLNQIGIREGNNILWFRGQNSADWLLQPGIMRKFKEINPHKSNIIYGPCIPCHDRLLPNYHQMIPLLYKYIKKTDYKAENDLEALAFGQNNLAITPLLDWSEDPLVALFFATNSMQTKEECPSQSAAMYVLKPLDFNKNIGVECIPLSSCFTTEKIDKLLWEHSHQWLCFKTPKIGYRICRQSGNFLFQNPQMPLINSEPNLLKNYIYKIIIPYTSIPSILQELKLLRITKQALYGLEPNADAKCLELSQKQIEALEKAIKYI